MSTIVAVSDASQAATTGEPLAAEAGPSFITPTTVTSIDESSYAQQLECKLTKLRQLFAEFEPPEVEVFKSPPSHYRMRAEFTVEQRDGDLHYVMFDNSSGAADSTGDDATAADGAGGDASTSGTVAGTAAADAQASTSAPAKQAAGKKRPRGPRRVRVESFPVASRQVNELMAAVRREASNNPVLRERLFQVNFHTTLAGDAMVTLLYHRKLGPEWQAAAAALRAALAATPTSSAAGRVPHVIGRSRKQKLELDCSHVEEVLHVGGRSYVQRQVEGAFSQPNGAVCQAMLGWALDVTRPPPPAAAEAETATAAAAPLPQEAAGAGEEHGGGSEGSAANGAGEQASGGEAGASEEAAAAAAAAVTEPTAVERAAAAASPAAAANGDLLELYCGNGNFTVPLAQNFRLVVATEVAKSSVEAARHNLGANGVPNVFLARMASEEFAETMRARGSRRRLAGLGPWEDLRLRTVLVDPPRAGLDDFTVQLLKEFDRIVYISCNPETLHANLRQLAASHRIERFAAFDQFPYTHHLEAGVYLVRR